MFLTIRYAIISILMVIGVLSSNNNIKATSIAKLPVDGVASYYADQFHGRTTANGEVFDMYALTCAHPSLPFGTMLKITNLGNDKSVIVRVNDRGPYVDARELDLSLQAATNIGMISEGISPVRIELASLALAVQPAGHATVVSEDTDNGIREKKIPKKMFFTCQIGVFAEPTNAERVVEICEDLHLQVITENIFIRNRAVTKITVGRLLDRLKAEEMANFLRKNTFDHIIIKEIY